MGIDERQDHILDGSPFDGPRNLRSLHQVTWDRLENPSAGGFAFRRLAAHGAER